MGGLWEAGIKSVKYHLKRALGRSRLTYEEFETVIIQIAVGREQQKVIHGSLEKMEYRLSEYSPTERKVDDREGQCNVSYNGVGGLPSILIWRERGSRNHPSNIIERDRYGGHGVLVWGGIMLGSRTDLHIFDAGSVNGTRYCNEILLPYVRLFRGAMGLQFLFMDDNAPCHRTVAAEQLLESRRLAARTLPPVTIRELRLALQDEWAAMPQQLIDTLILSMGRRCETCLAVRGDHIPY
ncbi:hypothetical protein TNCV_4730641 [Trichonephila clavipes]|nr:hypothetical protein TNCV_4730641 [Trichonephila clavipes]